MKYFTLSFQSVGFFFSVALLSVASHGQVNVGANALALSELMTPKTQHERLMEELWEAGTYAARVQVESQKLNVDFAKISAFLKERLEQSFSRAYLVKTNAEQIAKEFNESELAEVLRFYNSAIGKKWVDRPAQAKNKSLERLYEAFEELLPDLLTSAIETSRIE